MFQGAQSIAAKLSSVLGFPVNKESSSSSEKADQMLKEQIEMTEQGTHVNRV